MLDDRSVPDQACFVRPRVESHRALIDKHGEMTKVKGTPPLIKAWRSDLSCLGR